MTPSRTIPSVARLVAKRFLTDTLVFQTFHQPLIARRARPGQFVHLLTSRSLEPFFRRPMSILSSDPGKGTFSILLAVVGLGTRQLSATAVGEELPVLGPLGNIFSLPRGRRHAVLVAGGVGLPPLDFWARHLVFANRGVSPPEVTLLVGARSDAERIRLPRIAGARRFWSTDDGSFGYRGTVVDLLRSLQTKERWPTRDTGIYGCGPIPMLKALQEWVLAHSYRGQLSLESLMPCGFGVCSGCVVRTRPEKNGYERFVRVCREGPVFDVREVSL